MKFKLLAVVALAASGIFAATAFAAVPQGQITGGADVATSIGIDRVVFVEGVRDGEQEYVGQLNDKSYDCDGDTGAVNVTYSDHTNAITTITCAHYTGNHAGREGFVTSWYDAKLGTNVLFSVLDGGSPVSKDTIKIATLMNTAMVQNWVNYGYAGSGAQTAGVWFPQVAGSSGNYTVHS
jgi:hypothetical protein